jgi:phosphopantetheinyl transferase
LLIAYSQQPKSSNPILNRITMPLVHSEMIEETCTLLLWKLTEMEWELKENLGDHFNVEELNNISHPQKIREWLASRMLIKTLAEQFGIAYAGLHKDEHGKAFLIDNESHISITHTFEYVAVAINPWAAVGIDMEKSDPKLQRTAHKYLSSEEFVHAENEISKLSIYWCAKEALYKMYGKKKISFKDAIRIQPFSPEHVLIKGKLSDEALTVHSNIHIRWFDGHCLAIAL